MPEEWLVSVGKEWRVLPVSQSRSMAMRGMSFWSMTQRPSSVAWRPLGCGQGVYQRSVAETRWVGIVAVELSGAVAVMGQPYNARRDGQAGSAPAHREVRRGNDLRHLGRQGGRGTGGTAAGVQLPGVPHAGAGPAGAPDLVASVTGGVAPAPHLHGLPDPLAVSGAASGAIHLAREAAHDGGERPARRGDPRHRGGGAVGAGLGRQTLDHGPVR